ncbi:MAG: glycosyl transferase [Thermosynechococcaceae cyanobacterium]
MARPSVYVAITNHGFGHITRTASVLAELQRRCPDLSLIVATTAPHWLLEAYLSEDFIHRPRQLDIGVIQSDSLTMDRAATLYELQKLQSAAPALIKAESQFIRAQGVQLVLADIPPIATQIAKAAGVPCWMMSNFGWDLIYEHWGDEFSEMVQWIQACFAGCDRLFRLPFHAPMSVFPRMEDVGLTGGTPRFTASELRAKLNLTAPQEKVVLLTFGGLGLHTIPYHHLEYFPDWQFITFDTHAPEKWPNLIKMNGQAYRPVDIMPACGCLISKPGYGTFAEACRLEIPIISLPRADFAEAPYLLAGLQQYSRHQILEPGEFTTSCWEFLHRPLHPPQSKARLATNGNEAIAQAVLDFLVV